jgi:hypothetical protein
LSDVTKLLLDRKIHNREEIFFKARYAQKIRPCSIEYVSIQQDDNLIEKLFSSDISRFTHYKISFSTQPERCITPGQVVALFTDLCELGIKISEDNDDTLNGFEKGLECIGGGKIFAAGPSYYSTGKSLPLIMDSP